MPYQTGKASGAQKRYEDLGGAFAHGDVLDLNGLHDDIECSGG